MAPALYWKVRTAQLDKQDILSSGSKILKEAGFETPKIGTSQASAGKGGVHAFVGAVLKQKAPKLTPPLGDTTPHTYTVVLVAAGQGAKAALDDLASRWDNLHFL